MLSYLVTYLGLALLGGAFLAQLVGSICGIPTTKSQERYLAWANTHPRLQALTGSLWPLCSAGFLLTLLILH